MKSAFMIRKSQQGRMFFLSVLIISMLTAACEQLTDQDGSSGEGGGQETAIVFPAEGAHFSVGVFVDIHVTLNDAVGFNAAVLIANSQPLRRDEFLTPVDNGNLYQPWVPTAPGVYQLQILLEGGGGQVPTNIVTVYVDEVDIVAIEESAEEVPAVEEEEQTCLVSATSKGYPFCRSGPGTAYSEVTNLTPGQTVFLTSVSKAGGWYLVSPDDSSEECWVWRKLLEVSGDLNCLPVSEEMERDSITIEPEEEAPEESDPGTHPTKDPGSGPTTS